MFFPPKYLNQFYNITPEPRKKHNNKKTDDLNQIDYSFAESLEYDVTG